MYYLLKIFLVISLACLEFCTCSKLRIGIVGGGIGGTSACYFLQELLKDTVDIDVYEPYDIGGRLATTQVDDLHYETGGSIIHTDNRYVRQLMQAFNLTRSNKQADNVPNRFGLFDGTKFLFEESSYDWLTTMKLCYHYGPLNLYRFQSAVDNMLKEFANIYSLQEQKQSYSTLEQMLSAMSNRFVSQLTECADKGMKQETSQLILDELVSAGNLVNYGQTVFNMPEFVTFVSCAGMSGSLFSIAGGNKQLATGALTRCMGQLIRNKVTRIEYDSGQNKYIVHSKSGLTESTNQRKGTAEEEEERVYDYVIIATPLSLSDIQFVNMETSAVEQRDVKYHVTVTTLVKGTLNPNITATGITEILLTHPFYFYNSLSRLSSTNGINTAKVYKIFSQRALKSEELNRLFSVGEYDVVYEKHWRAYPEYKCRDNECGKYSKKKEIPSEKEPTSGIPGRDGEKHRETGDSNEQIGGFDRIKVRENAAMDEFEDNMGFDKVKVEFDKVNCIKNEQTRDQSNQVSGDRSECSKTSQHIDTLGGKRQDNNNRECIEEIGNEYCKETCYGNLVDIYNGSYVIDGNEINNVIDKEQQDIGGVWQGSCESKNEGRECLWTKKSNEKIIDSEQTTDKRHTGKIVGKNIEKIDNNNERNMDNDRSNRNRVKNNVKKLEGSVLENNSYKTDTKIVKTSEDNVRNSENINGKTEKTNKNVDNKINDKSSDEILYERIEKRESIRENVDNAGKSTRNNEISTKYQDKSDKKSTERVNSDQYEDKSVKQSLKSTKNDGKSTKNQDKSNKNQNKNDKYSFILHKQLYYVNVIELAASAMEMSLIGAKNVALLVYKDIENRS